MTDTRSSSAMFKRAEQLKRWEESDTNKQSSSPKRPAKIQFSTGIVFLAACASGDKEEVQRLLKMGADINTCNVDGLTALHQACIDDNLDMVEFLVTNGADVNRGDNEGWTPLHATASCGFLSIARYLLESGADVAAVNCDGELAVDIAESDAMEEMLQKVIDEKGIDCEKSRNAEVNSLLSDAKHWAANGYVDVRDPKTGGTPLHVAAAKGYVNVLKCLLDECGLEPDCVDYEGWTPLHAAALWGQKEAASTLMKNGADPRLGNYAGQTCMDLVDPVISSWLSEAIRQVNNNNNNNKKRKRRSPPRTDLKRVELQITGQNDNVVNDKPPAPEIIPKPVESKPEAPERAEVTPETEEPPSWRRSASFRNRQTEPSRDNKSANNNTTDNDTILRRTHSFENDKTSSPTTPEKKEKDGNAWSSPTTTSQSSSATNSNSTPVRSLESMESNSVSSNSTSTTTTPTKLSPGNIFKNFFKSFVPPVRDEESETQRKAHAKRVRETRRSTQGVTLDEIKSAEQLVKKKSGNGTTENSSPTSLKKQDEPKTTTTTENSQKRVGNPDVAVNVALASVATTATATIAPNTERRPSWRLRLDPTNKFELEDAGRASPAPTVPAPAVPVSGSAEATVTIPLRRPPAAPAPVPTAYKERQVEEEKDREGSTESKSSSSPASTQAALNVIQRRRRPKRRSTGVGHVDMDDIVNDRGGGGEGDVEIENNQSGSERVEDDKADEPDYKALYEASQIEVKRLRALLTTSEQQLRDARATITRLTQVNQNSLSEIEKREKRAMERKLSEMEEELKYQQALQVENQRLKDENGALIRVISKLSK